MKKLLQKSKLITTGALQSRKVNYNKTRNTQPLINMKTKSIIVVVAAVITVSSLVAFKSVNTSKPVAQKEISPNSGGFALKD
jgi:hypothetical protein